MAADNDAERYVLASSCEQKRNAVIRSPTLRFQLRRPAELGYGFVRSRNSKVLSVKCLVASSFRKLVVDDRQSRYESQFILVSPMSSLPTV